jgi:molybdopterin-guanine dinucleotide biosynthesis protein A
MALPSAYAAILGGGKSRRFGSDKALMTLDSHRVVDYITNILNDLFRQVFFIVDVRDKFHSVGITNIIDEIPGQGPLGGIHSALGVGEGDYCFITACDTPFVHPDIIRCLWEEIAEEDIIIPKHQGKTEPLMGFYSKRCRSDIETALSNGQRQAHAFLKNRNVRFVEMDDRFPPELLKKAFWNINTASDHEIAKNWYRELNA